MTEDSNELKPLPTEKLCNKWGKGNPILGDGALGNEKTGHMYYAGKEKKKLVITLQKMLKTLDYDLGTSGNEKNGVDGIFGDITEEDVLDFQGTNKDWDGKNLKVDGLVGPKTSDALNRAMVGKQYNDYKWYNHYQTPEKLVEGKPYHTVTSKFLTKGLLIEPGKAQKCKVFLVGSIPARDKENVVIEWPDEFTQYLPQDLSLELVSGDRKVLIPWGSGYIVSEMRRFVFEGVAMGQACTLMAYGGGLPLRLWNNQFATGHDPPTWEHWLEELFIDKDDYAAAEQQS